MWFPKVAVADSGLRWPAASRRNGVAASAAGHWHRPTRHESERTEADQAEPPRCACRRCVDSEATAVDCIDQLIARVRDASARYRVGLYSATELLRALADAREAACESVPTSVHDALVGAEALIAKARRTVAVPDRPGGDRAHPRQARGYAR